MTSKTRWFLAGLATIGLGFGQLVPAAQAAGGADVCELGVSTGTAMVTCSTTTASLLDIEIDSGTAADFAVCFDSAPLIVGGQTNLQDGSAANGTKIGHVVVTAANTTTHLPQGTPPVAAQNGIVCGKSVSTIRARVYLKK